MNIESRVQQGDQRFSIIDTLAAQPIASNITGRALSLGKTRAQPQEDPASSILYVSRRANGNFCELLKSEYWRVGIADSHAKAISMSNDGYRVGMLDLASGFGVDEVPIFEKLLSITNMIWLAVIDENQLDIPIIRRMISKYCIEYLTTPACDHYLYNAAIRGKRMHRLIYQNKSTDAEEVIGKSDAMQHLFRTIDKVSSTTAPVLILGESGTGKELTANAIHRKSSRRGGAFIAVNCGALPHSLVQSELFGYERGAFTGANQRRIGKVEAAHNGTLLLDEIGDLPLDSQANLLRFLQEGTIERLGSHESIAVDVRIISATHVDLEKAVRAGRFRSDLYHRLCVLRIDEPPLRARGTDIELLAEHMLERFRQDASHRIRGFSPDAIEALYSYAWPGNVRELINRVRRAVVMAEGQVITAADLELHEWATPATVTLAQARALAEQTAIQQALRRNNNRLNAVARELGISRVTLYRLMGHQRPRDEAAMKNETELC